MLTAVAKVVAPLNRGGNLHHRPWICLKAGVCEILEPDNPCEGIVCAGNGVCALLIMIPRLPPTWLSGDGAKCVEVEVEQVPPSLSEASPAVVMVLG